MSIGDRAILHPGAVVGSDGFGLARDGEQWLKVPQLGGVLIGDDVEIGASTMVTQSITHPGVYSSGLPAQENTAWCRNTVRLRQLDELARRLQLLEKKLTDS